MSSDQVAKLAATIEVLTGAVHFLIAERVAAQPAAAQGDLLHILQRAFSTPPRTEEALTGRAALAQADLALWMPIVAAGMMDEVRRQIGRPPEGVTHIVLGRGQPARGVPASEVAESPCREHARGAVAHFEGGRAVA
ncbi:hypothetical protein Q8W71_13340 [Methylobacterium sp. NEAU 140]|uniref:hypothetical protein n=1 Tax=Methylobacterium sp. NEAU 140 TaxID=3064945 RepID=UPI00273442CA|nr:hypothetical protein [Methylobacterium sp. NEAU 140]MDP4023617.1 hypothetical protein [Methylobacterium sp. NEAU 140]